MKNSKGFSLIELLAVIAILAVLIAIAVPRYLDAVDEARRNAQKQNVAIIRTALELYRHKAADKKYPSAGNAFNDFLTNPEYFTETPVCPYNNMEYTYTGSQPSSWTSGEAHYLLYVVNAARTLYTITYTAP